MIKKTSSMKRNYKVDFMSLRHIFINPILCTFIHLNCTMKSESEKISVVVFSYYRSSFVTEMHQNMHQLQTMYSAAIQLICSVQWNRTLANDIVRMFNNNINNNKNNSNNDKHWH